MNSGRNIFAQVMDFLPKKEFAKCVERYEEDPCTTISDNLLRQVDLLLTENPSNML